MQLEDNKQRALRVATKEFAVEEKLREAQDKLGADEAAVKAAQQEAPFLSLSLRLHFISFLCCFVSVSFLLLC